MTVVRICPDSRCRISYKAAGRLFTQMHRKRRDGLRYPAPPTRKAAEELHIARNLVIEVYEQLTAEGYLTSRTGSGTYVADGIEIRPARELPTSSTTETAPVPDRKERRFIDFDTGTPDLKHFPRRLWSKYVRETMNSEPDHIFTYSDIQGMRPLREAISRYVYRVKGISCSADQIMVTSGARKASCCWHRPSRTCFATFILRNRQSDSLRIFFKNGIMPFILSTSTSKG
ncbi:GntR family transcriptional regulator [Paenibacillus sp. P26]|nr:GntR family transcriptional regulator [Paenibacillus sp. P26]